MAGALLCVFFLLGVVTGFSESGHRVALRAEALLRSLGDRAIAGLGGLRNAADHFDQSIVPLQAMLRLRHAPAISADTPQAQSANRGGDVVAIVERRDGFYALLGGGEIRGPVSPNNQPDLPILSGPGADNALGAELLGDAALLVRAEAQLSILVSEMRLANDGTASLFLDRARMEIVVDLDQTPAQLDRAREVLKQWQGRERLIATLDMTTVGMAIVRLKTDLPSIGRGGAEPARNGAPQSGLRQVRVAEEPSAP